MKENLALSTDPLIGSIFPVFSWPHRSTADMPMTHRAMDGPVAPELDAELSANQMNPEAQQGALDSRSFYPGLGYSDLYPGGYAGPGYVTKTSYSSVQAPGVHHYTSRNHFVTQRAVS
jgi:hypothetical protein